RHCAARPEVSGKYAFFPPVFQTGNALERFTFEKGETRGGEKEKRPDRRCPAFCVAFAGRRGEMRTTGAFYLWKDKRRGGGTAPPGPK
ncbi:MAG: hypothetical protein MSH25_11380, partial [Desulfovibrio sp.]|uniref:hypothetical protein n=1 Tax=Desulfovibrio sp. TaxID=885 RepID=UPI0025C4A401